MEQHRVILITGAGSGIGAAIARTLASEHTSLLLHSRGADDSSKQAMQQVLDSVRALGAKAECYFADLNEPQQAKRIVEACVQAFGTVDQVVSNAGHASKKNLQEASSHDLAEAVQSMAGAFLELVQAARPYLEKSSCGSIVLTSSFVAHRFKPGELYPLTAAAKATAEALAMSLAAELAATGVTVNCVLPGYTLKDSQRYPHVDWQNRLPMPPLGRFGQPDDVAGAVAYLLSSHARYVTGQKLSIDGGLRLG